MPRKRPLANGDARPAIVFIHGTRLTGAQWAAQVAALEGEYRCITPDLPGHGAASDISFTVAGAAEAVAAAIETLAGGRAILVGLSLGGYVAMDVAARWPDRVAGLVLAGATAEPVWPRAILFRGLATLFTAFPEAWLDKANTWFFRTRYPAAIAEPIIAGGFHFATGAVAVRSLVGERFRPRLAKYPGRTLLINGEFDLLFRLTERSFAAAAVDARRVLLRRATHLTNLDQPVAFTAAVRRFAREVVGPAA